MDGDTKRGCQNPAVQQKTTGTDDEPLRRGVSVEPAVSPA